MNRRIALLILLTVVVLGGCNGVFNSPPDGNDSPTHGTIYEDEEGFRYYVVSESDTNGFVGIAEKIYGDGDRWRDIAQANPGIDPRRLEPGQELFLSREE